MSWRAIPDTEIILFGDEEGTKEIALELGLEHHPVEKSEYGTPYIADVFRAAQILAKGGYLCYVNCDIILYEDIQKTISRVPLPRFLITGKRWDLDVDQPTDTSSVAFWIRSLEEHTVQDFPGMDYFIFPKGLFTEMPRFIVGRRGWDNWLVYNARSRRIPVVDASAYIVAIHQNHDYSHIPESKGNRWEKCPESDYNLALIRNRIVNLWELEDATHFMDFARYSSGMHWDAIRKPLSIRKMTQGIIIRTPTRFHGLIEPFYRAGHISKWAYLKSKKYLSKKVPRRDPLLTL